MKLRVFDKKNNVHCGIHKARIKRGEVLPDMEILTDPDSSSGGKEFFVTKVSIFETFTDRSGKEQRRYELQSF